MATRHQCRTEPWPSGSGGPQRKPRFRDQNQPIFCAGHPLPHGRATSRGSEWLCLLAV